MSETSSPNTLVSAADVAHGPPARGESGRHAEPNDPVRADVEAYYQRIAPYYDAELAERGDEPFWCALAEAYQGGRVLELGAGSGRVTALLAPAVPFLVGIDLSPDLLTLARRRLASWPHVRLVRADMRSLALRARFDLIVAANDPFSHLTDGADRDRAIESVARHLAPGGRFVLDALWLPPAEDSAVSGPHGRATLRIASVGGRPVHVLERWQRQPGYRWCQARYEYRQAEQPPVTAQFEARDWSPDELRARLDRAGLTIAEAWGSYDGITWDARRSRHLVVEACLA